MRDIAAVIAPAADLGQIERELQREIVAMQDADRAEAAAVERVATTAEAARRQRVVVGRRLVEAKRAAKHGQWLPWLEKMGVSTESASRWMRLAGFVEAQVKFGTDENVPNLGSAPTLADAGIDRRPRKADEPEAPRPQAPQSSAQSSESIVLASLMQTLGVVARQWPGDLNRLIAELRRYADKLERRTKEQP